MKTVTVSASRRYDILIERGLLRRAGKLVRGVTNAGTVMLVSDDSVWPLYGKMSCGMAALLIGMVTSTSASPCFTAWMAMSRAFIA